MIRLQALRLITLHAVTILLALLVLPGCGNRPHPLKRGSIVPSFAAEALDGHPISLDAFKGKPVVLRFFLTNCRFCLADTPVFNTLFKNYAEKGLKMVYINNDAPDVATVTDFARKLAIPFPVVFDPEGKIAARYNIKIQPMTLVLDPEHRLTAALLGGVGEAELDDLVSPFFK